MKLNKRNLFFAPVSNDKDHFKQGKYKLIWNTYIIFFFLSFSLSIVHSIHYNKNLIFTSLGLAVSICCLLLLKIKKNYKITSVITLFTGTIATQSMIYVQINPYEIVDLIWIFSISIFAFYILGYKWGVITLATNIVGIVFWQFYYGDNYNSVPLSKFSTGHKIDYFFNIIFGLIIICYMIIRFIKENRYATDKYIHTNKELSEKNSIVNEQHSEKTIMLKEIHHRVKNNLQIIISLLRLQSQELKETESILHFKDATNRIIAMALIHDKMYRSENLTQINVTNYLTELINDLVLSYSIEIPIEKSICSDIKQITPKILVPIALLFNELVTNSLKHGFKEKSNGKISIKISLKNEQVTMKYSDNGNWVESPNRNSFGVELIDALTEQLDGELYLDTTNGTAYTFIFPYKSI